MEKFHTQTELSSQEIVSSQENIQNSRTIDITQHIDNTFNFASEMEKIGLEKTEALNEINILRQSLGLPLTQDPPMYIQEKLNNLQNKKNEENYIDFEMIKEDTVEEKELLAIKQEFLKNSFFETCKSIFSQINEMSLSDIKSLKETGLYSNGTSFIALNKILFTPVEVQKIIFLYENYKDSSVPFESIPLEEVEDLISPDISLKIKTVSEQKFIENQAEIYSQLPDKKEIDYTGEEQLLLENSSVDTSVDTSSES